MAAASLSTYYVITTLLPTVTLESWHLFKKGDICVKEVRKYGRGAAPWFVALAEVLTYSLNHCVPMDLRTDLIMIAALRHAGKKGRRVIRRFMVAKHYAS